MKWDFGQFTIRNAYVHDNDCKGLWGDINAHNAPIEDNLVENNRAEVILYEISQDATIRNNRIYRNGFGSFGWYWGGGITVTSTGSQQDRLDSTPPAHLLDGYHVHDNLICATGDGGTPPAWRPTTAPTSPPGNQLDRQHHPVGRLRAARLMTRFAYRSRRRSR